MKTCLLLLVALLAQPKATDSKPVSAIVLPGQRLSKERIAELETILFFAGCKADDEEGPWIDDDDVAQITGARHIWSVAIGGKSRVTNKLFDVLKTLPKLRVLVVDDCAITDDGLQVLATIDTLTWVEFDGCRLTDRGVAQLAKLPRLEVLKVEDCSVVGACFRELSRIKSLRELSVMDTSVDDRVGKCFDGFPQLEKLGLRGTEVTNGLFTHLARLKSLKVVEVTGTEVTRERIKKFRSRHPGIDVHKFW